jgi:outer membrane protein TolC
MSEHRIIRILTTGILLTAGAFAQTTSFPKPDYFRQTFKNVDTKVVLQAPVRLRDYVKNGQIEISLRDYLSLAMANNTQVQVQYLTLETSRNNITSVYGLWDPRATASFNPSISTQDALPNSPGCPASGCPTSHTWPVSFGWSETLSSGQTINVTGGGQKFVPVTGGNSQFGSNLGFNITQPLLQGRGAYVTRIPLMSAQSRYKQQGFNLTSNLLTLIGNAENVYWNAVGLRETVAVNQSALDAAKYNWDFVQRQFNLGAVSYLDTYNPQTAVAVAQLALAQSGYNLAAAEDAVRNQISIDLDPDLRKLPLKLTESVDLPESEAVIPDKELEVQRALDLQPSLKSVTQNLDIDDLSIASAKNGLQPQLNLKIGYSGSGAGQYYTPVMGTTISPLAPALPTGISTAEANYLTYLTPQTTVFGSTIPGGLGDAMGQAFGWGNPTYGASLTLTLPIRNRTASMTMANALIQKKNDALNVRNTQQSIRLAILNAVVALQNAEESLKLANTQENFASLNLDAEHTKYALGNETQQNVVTAQQILASAQLGVVNAKITLQKAVLGLYSQTGELLDKRGIVVKTP